MMRIECPSCGVSGTADESYRGKKIRCPKCDEVFSCQQEDELVEITEEVEVGEELEEAGISSPDEQENVPAGEDIAEDVTEELVDLPEAVAGQLPDKDLIVELCDYCSAKGKPGERFEIVDMKKACSDCFPILAGSGGTTANGFQPIHGEYPESQSTHSEEEKQGKKSLTGRVVNRFKKLFSR